MVTVKKRTNSRSNIHDHLTRLSPEQLLNLKAVVNEFIDNYSPEDIRQISSEWLTTALSTSPSLYDQGRERSNLLFFYEGLFNYLAASMILLRLTPTTSGMTNSKLKKKIMEREKKLKAPFKKQIHRTKK